MIRKMVRSGDYSGPSVRRAIDKHLANKYDDNENLKLVTWLRDNDWDDTAEYLADELD